MHRILFVAALAVAAMFLVSQPTVAQDVPEGPISFGPLPVSGSTPTSGQYQAVMGEGAAAASLTGSYEGTVTFSGSVSGVVTDLLAVNGTFTTDGSYSASVAPSEREPMTVTGSWNGGGAFTVSTFTVNGSFSVSSPVTGSGTFNGSGTYDASNGSATVSGTYNGTVATPEGDITVSGTFSGGASVPPPALPNALTAAQFGIPASLIQTIGRLGPTAALSPSVGSTVAAQAAGAATGGGPGGALALHAGWNLVAWLGANSTPVAEAVAQFGATFEGLHVWDAETQRFRSFVPGLPAALQTAGTLNFGDGIWIRVSRAATWVQPAGG